MQLQRRRSHETQRQSLSARPWATDASRRGAVARKPRKGLSAAVVRALQKFEGPGGIDAPTSAHIVTATRSAPPAGSTDRRSAASACGRRDRRAVPPRPPAFIARAISTGSLASAIAVFISTPSQPSSIATAASLAVPTPASTSTGTLGALDDQPDGDAVLDAEARADRRAQRHDRDRAGFLELLRGDRIVDAIDHRLEAFLHQHLGRAQRLAHVGIERLRLAQHLELHEVPAARLARQPKRADRVLGGEAAGGVGQVGDLLRDR